MDIGRIIHLKRTELNLTLEDVGKAVGVGKSTVKKWEDGYISNMRRDKIARLAKVLRLNPVTFVTGEMIPESKSDNDFDDADNVMQPTGMVAVYGRIAAGLPVFADENIEGYYPVMVKRPEEHFYLRVRGDSMIGAGIKDGCLVLLRKQNVAENGQIVACRVNGDEATLKRFKQQGDTVLLLPENSEYEPRIVPCSAFESGEAEILGVAVQVVTVL